MLVTDRDNSRTIGSNDYPPFPVELLNFEGRPSDHPHPFTAPFPVIGKFEFASPPGHPLPSPLTFSPILYQKLSWLNS